MYYLNEKKCSTPTPSPNKIIFSLTFVQHDFCFQLGIIYLLNELNLATIRSMRNQISFFKCYLSINFRIFNFFFSKDEISNLLNRVSEVSIWTIYPTSLRPLVELTKTNEFLMNRNFCNFHRKRNFELTTFHNAVPILLIHLASLRSLVKK